MKAQTPCQAFEAHLTPYLLGDLTPAQAAAVKAHVEQCPACQATLRELSATVDLLQNAFAAETAAPPLCLTPERRATVVRQARRKPRPAGVWALLTHPSAKIALKAAAVVALLLAIVAVLVPQMARNARMYEVVGTGAGDLPRPSVSGLLHGWFGGNGGAKLAYHLDRGAPAASVDVSEVAIHEAAMPADAFEDHGVAANPARSEGKSAGAHYYRGGAGGGGSGSGVAGAPPPAPPIPVLSRRPGMPPPESAPGSAGTALTVQDEAQTSDGAFGPSGRASREKGKASGVAKKLEYFDYDATTKQVQKAPAAASDDWSGPGADQRNTPVAMRRTSRPVGGTEGMSENIVRDPWAPGRDALNKAAARGARLSGKGDLSKAANEEAATDLALHYAPAETKPAADAAATDGITDVLSLGGDVAGKATLGLKRDRSGKGGADGYVADGTIVNGTAVIVSGEAVTATETSARPHPVTARPPPASSQPLNKQLADNASGATGPGKNSFYKYATPKSSLTPDVAKSARGDASQAGQVAVDESRLGDVGGQVQLHALQQRAPATPPPPAAWKPTILGRLFHGEKKAKVVTGAASIAPAAEPPADRDSGAVPEGEPSMLSANERGSQLVQDSKGGKLRQTAVGGGAVVDAPVGATSNFETTAGDRELREETDGRKLALVLESQAETRGKRARAAEENAPPAAPAPPPPTNAPGGEVTQSLVVAGQPMFMPTEPAPLLAGPAVAATTTPAAPSATPANATDAGVQATNQKLAKVVVDKFEVDEKPVRQVIAELNRKVAAAGGKPVEIVFESDKREADEKAGAATGKEAAERTVTMSMNNIPVGEVVRYVCLGAGLKSRVENGRVVITEKFQAMEDIAKPAAKPPPLAEPLGGPVFAPPTFNAFVDSAANAFSTFSIAVDTAAYTLARRYILQGQRPAPGGVKVEDFINSFEYEYAPPAKNAFAIYADVVPSPFRRSLDVLKVGIKGYRIGRDRERQAILTVLIDTSGSMNTPDRLELARQALHLLIEHMNPNDQVALVQFDSKARLVLPHTAVADKAKLLAAVDTLQTGGSTNLDAGIRLAYEVAAGGFRPTGSNRVILFSDGMANLGTASATSILKDVENYRKQGIYCSIFGVGTGNYNDVMLGTLAEKGDGVYKFIDSLAEAKRVLVDDISATLHVIAKDVKIQVQFNPDRVARYRQLGYENRQLTKEQFRDDTVDAGEVGSGQAVTALYELAPGARPDEPVGVVRVRYRDVETGKIVEIEKNITVNDRTADVAKAPARVRLALGVAEFAELLRGSPNVAGSDFNEVLTVLRPVAQELRLDAGIQELVRLVQAARGLPAAE